MLYFRSRFWPKPVRRNYIVPHISIVLAVRNEEKHLSAKLANVSALEYPEDRLEVVVVSDGSTDTTNEILEKWKSCNRRAHFLPEHAGKATALNHAVGDAQGEIIVFTDGRQMIAPEALKNLLADFADPSVGCVSGELMLSDSSDAPSGHGVGVYWRLEKKIRYWEGLAGSTVGATGAFYAVRKDLLSAIPEETILDDVYIPLIVIRQGQRVVFEPLALARDYWVPSVKEEFRRKVRTLAGNYQLLQLASWVVTQSNPVRIQFVCHKLLRLFAPFALVGMLVSTVWIRKGTYEAALGLQLVFYALAALSAFRVRMATLSRLSNISFAFVLLNAAAAMAFVYFITGRKAAWAR